MSFKRGRAVKKGAIIAKLGLRVLPVFGYNCGAMCRLETDLMTRRTTIALEGLEETLGYTFKNRALLLTALTAPSYKSDPGHARLEDNQRLEFLGDAVLGLLSAQRLYLEYAGDKEGALTVRRSHLTSGRALALVARQIDLGRYLLLGGPEMRSGVLREGLLADALEAIFGAAWCDGGLEAAHSIFERIMPPLKEHDLNPWAENPKGRLQELCQSLAWHDSPQYEVLETGGPDHDPEFKVSVKVRGGHTTAGLGKSKKAAECAAAAAMLQLLGTHGISH